MSLLSRLNRWLDLQLGLWLLLCGRDYLDSTKYMKPAQFIKEHLRLVKLLKSGSKKQQRIEAAGQAAELKKYLIALKKK